MGKTIFICVNEALPVSDWFQQNCATEGYAETLDMYRNKLQGVPLHILLGGLL